MRWQKKVKKQKNRSKVRFRYKDSQNGIYKIKIIKRECEDHEKICETDTHRSLQITRKAPSSQCLVGISKFSLTESCGERLEPHSLVLVDPLGLQSTVFNHLSLHHFITESQSVPLQSLLYVSFPPSSSCSLILKAEVQHCIIRGKIWIHSGTSPVVYHLWFMTEQSLMPPEYPSLLRCREQNITSSKSTSQKKERLKTARYKLR